MRAYFDARCTVFTQYQISMHPITAIGVLVSTQMLMLIFTKRVTDRQRLPLLLCQTQFVISSFLSYLFIFVRQRTLFQQKSSKQVKVNQHSCYLMPKQVLLQSAGPLSLCWTLGFVLFNASASLMSPAVVNLVRCAEPLATAVVGMVFMGKQYSTRVLSTLIPICGGVILAASANNSNSKGGVILNTGGVFLACLSNLSFCFRPFLMHRLKNTEPHASSTSTKTSFDDMQVFFNVAVIASVVLPPIVLLVEGSSIPLAMSQLIKKGELGSFLLDLVGSAVCFFLYQFTQLQIMSSMSPLAFSILTPVVKATMIVVCSFYFGDAFGVMSAIGVLTTTGGGYLFSAVSKAEAPSLLSKKNGGVLQGLLPLHLKV
jgi:drug/metabolite transporter (DMT)-like permease